MAKNKEQTRTLDGLQSVAALIGITLGVIPFARWTLTGEFGGLFRWIFGPLVTLDYVAPLLVVAAAVGVISALEMIKRRA